jgi:hypothetical protein
MVTLMETCVDGRVLKLEHKLVLKLEHKLVAPSTASWVGLGQIFSHQVTR